MKIEIGVSARHVHLSKEDFEILFGKNEKLNKLRDLRRPGEFAAQETVTVKTAKNKFDNVRIIGPIRDYTQVEISKTDSYFLGIEPPIRNSGDIIGSSPITILTDKGEVTKEFGCIIPARHIHISTAELNKNGWSQSSTVKVKLLGEKAGTIENVYVRIVEDNNSELHIDLDDANAHNVKSKEEAEVIFN